jgi:hypothetical protein
MSRKTIEGLYVKFLPYVMWVCGCSAPDGANWDDSVNNRRYPCHVKFNSLGFSADFDFQHYATADYIAAHGKKPGERLVIVTGGSAMHGVGATSNDSMLSGQLERTLNERQDAIRYRVLNLGMGSWISFQQSIGLDMWGAMFDPDWVVVMDGTNDAASIVNSSAGIGNPMFWPAMQWNLHDNEQRSPLVDYLVEKSAWFRRLTGKKPQNSVPGLAFNPHAGDPRFAVHEPGSVAGLAYQLAFYADSQRSILRKFDNARFLLSTQPYLDLNLPAQDWFPTFRPAFAATNSDERAQARAELAKDLQRWMMAFHNHATPAGGPVVQAGIKWFLAHAALAMEELAAKARASGWRDAVFVNGELALPAAQDLRKPYFMDHTHFTDAGHKLMGEFYADRILAADQDVIAGR